MNCATGTLMATIVDISDHSPTLKESRFVFHLSLDTSLVSGHEEDRGKELGDTQPRHLSETKARLEPIRSQLTSLSPAKSLFELVPSNSTSRAPLSSLQDTVAYAHGGNRRFLAHFIRGS